MHSRAPHRMQSTAEFWESTWERAPRLYPATAARNSLLTGLCTLPALRPLLSQFMADMVYGR